MWIHVSSTSARRRKERKRRKQTRNNLMQCNKLIYYLDFRCMGLCGECAGRGRVCTHIHVKYIWLHCEAVCAVDCSTAPSSQMRHTRFTRHSVGLGFCFFRRFIRVISHSHCHYLRCIAALQILWIYKFLLAWSSVRRVGRCRPSIYYYDYSKIFIFWCVDCAAVNALNASIDLQFVWLRFSVPCSD